MILAVVIVAIVVVVVVVLLALCFALAEVMSFRTLFCAFSWFKIASPVVAALKVATEVFA